MPLPVVRIFISTAVNTTLPHRSVRVLLLTSSLMSFSRKIRRHENIHAHGRDGIRHADLPTLRVRICSRWDDLVVGEVRLIRRAEIAEAVRVEDANRSGALCCADRRYEDFRACHGRVVERTDRLL